MPQKEKYGAQPPIEILRQYFDYGGWYDRKEKEFLTLKNILIKELNKVKIEDLKFQGKENLAKKYEKRLDFEKKTIKFN